MSHNSGFFPSQNGDREYDADDFRKFVMSFVGDGLTRIDGDESGFEVIAESPASMNVVVGKGSAIIKGSWLNPDSDTTISIPTASSSGNRYDAIVLEFNNTVGTRAVTISVVQGTASANPDYPDMIDTDSIKQLPIAYVYVGIGVTSIDDSNIIDNRGTNSCPYASATMDRQELVLPIASNTTLGAIKVGRNLRIEADGTLNATGGGGGGASALSDLEDVDIDFETLANKQALIYDAVAEMWKNENAETEPPSLATLPDVNIENLQFGQILRFNSTNGKWENCNWNELPINKTFEKQANVTPLNTARYNMMSAKAGNQLIFAGGQGVSASYNVDAYNDSLTRTVPLPLTSTRYDGAGASVGDYAIFAGGGNTNRTITKGSTTLWSGLTPTTTVEGYDSSLTKVTVTSMTTPKERCSGIELGDVAIIAGGVSNNQSGNNLTVQGGNSMDNGVIESYDASLTLTTASAVSQRYSAALEKVGNVAIFAGGRHSPITDFYTSFNDITTTNLQTVDVIDESLTVSSAPDLSAQRYSIAGASTPTHAVFGGGYESAAVATVEAYDDSLTKSALASLGSARYTPNNLDGAYNDGWTIFSGVNNNNVDAYDGSFTKAVSGQTGVLGEPLDPARTYIKLDTIGDYFVFAGGYANSASSDVVEAYKVNHY